MAVFFGMMQGALSRRWGYVDTAEEDVTSPVGRIRMVLRDKLGRIRGMRAGVKANRTQGEVKVAAGS